MILRVQGGRKYSEDTKRPIGGPSSNPPLCSVQKKENDSEVPSDKDGEEEGEVPEQDSDSTPTVICSHASIAQELIKDLSESRGKEPLKDVSQSQYQLVIAQLQDCSRNETLPPGDLQDRVFACLKGDGRKSSDGSEERLAELSVVRVSPTQPYSRV